MEVKIHKKLVKLLKRQRDNEETEGVKDSYVEEDGPIATQSNWKI